MHIPPALCERLKTYSMSSTGSKGLGLGYSFLVFLHLNRPSHCVSIGCGYWNGLTSSSIWWSGIQVGRTSIGRVCHLCLANRRPRNSRTATSFVSHGTTGLTQEVSITRDAGDGLARASCLSIDLLQPRHGRLDLSMTYFIPAKHHPRL
jgi:hypothetical protein